MGTAPKRDGAFVISELNGLLSRDQVVLKSNGSSIQSLAAGLVLGAILTGTATSAAGTNTGNGTMGTVTVGAGAKAGVYTLLVTKAATNAGDFQVTDPLGNVVGIGTVGVAFAGGGLSFTLADGATDFVRGDSFLITVAAGSGKYVALNPSNTDGSQIAAGILFGAASVPATGDITAAIVNKDAEVASAELGWGSLSAPQIVTAKAQLALLGIKVRASV